MMGDTFRQPVITGREGFEEHAAIEAIVAAERKAARIEGQFHAERRWLTALAKIRRNQIQNGKWAEGGDDEEK